MTDVQVSLETGSGLERRLRVQLPAQRVDQEVETRLKSAGMTVRLKGFRPGKVPVHVIRQRFGPQIRQEVVQDLIQTSCAEAITRENLRPAATPRIEMGTLDAGQDVIYTAVFEIYPDFRVAGVEGLSILRSEVAVTDDDINHTIERLRTQRANWTPVDRKAQQGDRVLIDFNGTRNGEPIAGGKAERVGVVIGEGRMVGDFEAGLVGIAPGDDKTFLVTFPSDYHEESLRGARVNFDVHAHEVAERSLPDVDADFIRGFQVASGDAAEFRRLVRENLEREAAAKIQAELRRQVMEGLLQANPVEVPLVMVEREATSLQAEAMRNLGLQDPKDAPALTSYEDVARRRVRLGLIIGALIHEQGLKVDPVRVDLKVEELCQPYERPEEVRKLYLQSPELMAQIENSVMEEQAMAWLIERAKVSTTPVTFSALMGVQAGRAADTSKDY